MNHIDIYTPTSYGAANAAIALINGLGVDAIRSVHLRTTKEAPDLINTSETWPVIFQCRSPLSGLTMFEIRVGMATSGYYGTAPYDLVRLLKAAGFDFNSYRILEECPIDEIWTK